MDQYNRLLDIFNLENGSNDKKGDPLKQLNKQDPMSPEKKLQLLQKHHQQSQQQNRYVSPSRQSMTSNYTGNGSNIPTSINDGLTGSAHDLRMQSEFDEDSKSYSTVNRVQIKDNNNNNKRQLSSLNDNKKKQNEQLMLINSSSIMTSDTNLYQSKSLLIEIYGLPFNLLILNFLRSS